MNCSANNSANKIEFRELESIQLILNLISSPNLQVKLLALGALSNLSLDAENRFVTRECGGIKIIVDLLDDENPEVNVMAVRTISWLCYTGKESSKKIPSN